MARIIRKLNPVLSLPPRQLNVAAYARVSAVKDSMLHSLSAQVSFYSNHIQNHIGWRYVGVYADSALTGTKAERPEFQRLLADCRAGKIDMVITKSISRFARNTVTLLKAVRELKALGVDIYFEEQNIHSISAAGELMLTILASYAQEESRVVSENCKWRIRKKFEKGISTTTRLNGYTMKRGTISPNEREANVVRMIFRDYLSGMGKDAICRKLNRLGIPAKNGGIWHESVVKYILNNEKYQGDLLLQKKFTTDHLSKAVQRNRGELPKYVVKDNHEALVSRDVYADTQALFREKVARLPSSHAIRATYPFTGKLVCVQCGKHFKRRVNTGKIAWQCSTFMQRGKRFCAAKQIREIILESAAAAALGLAEFDAGAFEDRVREVRVGEDNRLVFILKDGQMVERQWEAPSRRDSWDQSMRLQAAERTRRRYEQ